MASNLARQPAGPRPLKPSLQRMLNLLNDGPASISELATATQAGHAPLSETTVKHYLDELHHMRLVQHLEDHRWDVKRRCTRCQESTRRAPAQVRADLLSLQRMAAAALAAMPARDQAIDPAAYEASLLALSTAELKDRIAQSDANARRREDALWACHGVALVAAARLAQYVGELQGLCSLCARPAEVSS